ncbi:MAG: hypothetical protein IT334_05330 [Thermomicrobiales bacterium]|nr:hypothetical protein [Thermomicrobiales bacterium]
MDGQQFDRFARALGTGKSRRSVIKGLVATWVGGAAVVKTTSNADATIICIGEGLNCNVNDTTLTCCAGMTCWYTNDEGAGYCEYDQNICSNVGGSCAEFPCCLGGDCVGGVCEYDDFETCGTIDQFCGLYGKDNERACCEGHECIERDGYSFCDPIQSMCIPEGESCGDVTLAQDDEDDDCCGDLVCIRAEDERYVCGYPPEEPEEPTDPGEPAKPEVPVTQLPDTGAGQNGQGAEWLIPTALGAAAAAVVGGKLLKGERSTTEG